MNKVWKVNYKSNSHVCSFNTLNLSGNSKILNHQSLNVKLLLSRGFNAKLLGWLFNSFMHLLLNLSVYSFE